MELSTEVKHDNTCIFLMGINYKVKKKVPQCGGWEDRKWRDDSLPTSIVLPREIRLNISTGNQSQDISNRAELNPKPRESRL
jgi:hypothetical protein